MSSLYSAARPFSISADLVVCSKLQILCLSNLDTFAKRSGKDFVQMCSTICKLPSLTSLSICDASLQEYGPTACSFSSKSTTLELECGLLELPPAVLQLLCLEQLSFWADADAGIGVPPVASYLDNLTYLSLRARPRDVSSEFFLAARRLRCLSLHSHQEDISYDEVAAMLPYVPGTCEVALNESWWSPET